MFSEAILPRYDPILPYPIIPSTEADKSYPNKSNGSKYFHLPSLTNLSHSAILLAAACIRVNAKEAVVSVNTPGVFATAIFLSLAASTSTLS